MRYRLETGLAGAALSLCIFVTAAPLALAPVAARAQAVSPITPEA